MAHDTHYKHMLVEFGGVDAERLRDSAKLMDGFGDCLVQAGFHIVKRVSHQFEAGGEGFTGVFILSESHMVVHTYPEFGYLALDLFSCAAADPSDVLQHVKPMLEADKVLVHQIARSAP